MRGGCSHRAGLGPALCLALVLSACGVAHAAEGSGPTWSSLSTNQREVLAPLASDWDNMDSERKTKWLEVAQRFPSMQAAKQERVRQRMVDWSRMSPDQRSAARRNFQQSKQLPAEQRQAQWDAYRALPPEEREALLNRARPTAAPRSHLDDAPMRKSNVVPGLARADAPAPRAVAPALVQGNPGATTSLITQPPAPPSHLQPGRPKIAASPNQVDRATLLPKRGNQDLNRPAAGASGPKR